MFAPLGRRAARGRRRFARPATAIEALECRLLLSAAGSEAWLFDFGTTTSAVEPGYTRVTHLDGYSEAAGYGWLSSPVFSASRSGGTALTRDLNFSSDMTFGVDLANGTYDVTLTIGDLFSFHDQMGVFFEGQQFDEISTLGGEVLVRTYSVHVSDGQLTLRLFDLGGSDANAVINGLEIRPAPLDTTGPRVVDAEVIADGFGYVSGVRLAFDEPILAGTFTLADVVSLNGPDGAIAVAEVNQLDLTRFDVLFAKQLVPGEYTLVIGPDIQDLAGNSLDQDGDGVGGELDEDQFTFTFTIEPLVALFDFGTATSPVEQGYLGVDPGAVYDPQANFGWLSGTVLSALRSSGTALERDLHFSTDATFAVDVANAVYEVTIYMGDTGNFAHDEMGVFLEGVQVDHVSTAAGQVVTRTYRVSVSDGQLTLRLADLGGTDANAVINGLEVRFLGIDVFGPRVVGVDPGATVVGSFDRVTLTFDEAIREGTFTVEDVVSFAGPAGAVTPTAVNRLSDVRFEIVFDRQFSPGSYTLTIGPAIEDVAGNPMDQDQDGVNGEALDDRFIASFTLEPFLVAFDFGTETSPLA
ncbi:MAG TPA: Ig-like domain-containing protein, partial [Planctomycetaceae bacterium]|nr:Ig-like domain-containing protein [Planctomycetaceae bacterium]